MQVLSDTRGEATENGFKFRILRAAFVFARPVHRILSTHYKRSTWPNIGARGSGTLASRGYGQ